jgi:uncharacterized membrane-anchored protein YhcB (DUF1043 family)
MRKDNLRIGQIIVLNQVQNALTQFTAVLMHMAQSAPSLARVVDEEDLPLNSAHIRAAGLLSLDAIEQVINSLTDDGLFDEDDEVQDMLEGLQEALDECRDELTQVPEAESD